jgi:hypothetical protein
MPLSADTTLPDTSVGIRWASSGLIRRFGSGADERMTMTGPAALMGSSNCPVNFAPAWSTISSPGFAALSTV